MTQDPGSSSPMTERMQSMLSRAVEDQLSEQRELLTELAQMRALLVKLGDQLQSTSPRPGGEVEPGSASPELRQSLDGLARLVQERGHDLAEQRAAIAELRDAVTESSRALGGLTGGLGALPSFGERIDALQGGLSGLNERLGGIEELRAAVMALQGRSEGSDAALRELRQAFTGVAARAVQLPARDDIESITGRVGDAVEGVANRLGRLEASVPSILERLDAIGVAQTAQADFLAGLQQRLDHEAGAVAPGAALTQANAAALEQALEAISERLAALDRPTPRTSPELADLATRVDTLHDGLFGENGIGARLNALAQASASGRTAPLDTDQEAVADLVARAVAESEQRLADHVDNTVLLLAEALLRRRPTRSGGDAPAAAPPVGQGATAGATPVPSGGETAGSAAESVLADLARDAEEDEDDDALDDEDVDGGLATASWHTPAAPAPPSEPAMPSTEGPSPEAPSAEGPSSEPAPPETGPPSKRKPWWRPGG